jgi:putative spermidine/putrescine transport system ATP-binding protein
VRQSTSGNPRLDPIDQNLAYCLPMNWQMARPHPSDITAGRPVKVLIDGISKSYGPVEALQPTTLEILSGEFVTILGPSGSGKTTLLQIVSGLVDPSSGRVFIDGADQARVPAHRRGIGVVFQNYALFPHLTVAENVAFPLRMRRIAAAALRAKLEAALEMVGLAQLRDRFPRELSGGQQQRVALARCFVYAPSLILMDEPLGALDRKLREAMQIELKRLHRETGATIIFVTHDQDEALALSDRVCLMNNAKVEQFGTPQAIYQYPTTTFAAEFVGISNMLRGTVGGGGDRLDTPDGAFVIPPTMRERAVGGRSGVLVIRPEHMEVATTEHANIHGTLIESVYAGSETRLLVALASGTVVTVRRATAPVDLRVGDSIGLSWAQQHAIFLEA